VPFPQLVAKSRRVIAPWLRGYALSPLAGPLDIENLVADVLALIDKLGAKQADFLGHDWGAATHTLPARWHRSGYAVLSRSHCRIR
jgi:pimeloyl-ACP methyl ester carboxylesterase